MLPPDVLLLEKRSLGAQGEATLGEAYEALVNYWRCGCRDRDIGLHLLFLAWYLMREPAHSTGLAEESLLRHKLQETFNEVHTRYEAALGEDAEFLYVVGLMAHLSPDLLGDKQTWTERSCDYRARCQTLSSGGISADIFDEGNAYGAYFARQARSVRP